MIAQNGTTALVTVSQIIIGLSGLLLAAWLAQRFQVRRRIGLLVAVTAAGAWQLLAGSALGFVMWLLPLQQLEFWAAEAGYRVLSYVFGRQQ